MVKQLTEESSVQLRYGGKGDKSNRRLQGEMTTLLAREIEPQSAHVHEITLTGDRFVVHTELPAAIAIALFTEDNRLICKKAMSAPFWISPQAGGTTYKVRIANEGSKTAVKYALMSLTHYLDSMYSDVQCSAPARQCAVA